jgi:trehalose 6-phosphate phosphatase
MGRIRISSALGTLRRVIDDRLEELVAVLRQAPERSAVLLDIDGTLAPIAANATDARVPDATRATLAQLVDRFALVACVSGRQAVEARRIVGLDRLDYLGNHGLESLSPGADAPETLAEATAWHPRVRAFALAALDDHPEAAANGLWIEDKGPIQALHWRTVADQDAVERTVAAIATAATEHGLALHHGRKVLELRPPLAFDKGSAIERLLSGRTFAAGLYAGDDHTDVDAFAGLRALRDQGMIGTAVCVAVRDAETPDAVADAADVAVDGTEGLRRLLDALVLP